MSVNSLSMAIKAVIISGIGSSLMGLNHAYSGFIIYKKYQDCDPLSSGFVSKTDQMLPYYVMQNLSYIPGLAGLFVAAVFSASLRSVLFFCL